MGKISLNASMRNNLLSLQNISKSVALTQNRLSTGLKVNSAIDNPSSYYTARSLNNRANDLSALLDSMGQAIQIIKAATTGLESAAAVLEQMSAIAEQTITEAGYIPHDVDVKFDTNIQKLLDEGYTAVATVQDLQKASKENNAKIVLTEDISFDGGLSIFQGTNVKINGGGHTLSSKGLNFYYYGVTLENIKLDVLPTPTHNYSSVIKNNGGNFNLKNVEINQQNSDRRANVINVDGTANIENVKINISGNIEDAFGIYLSNGGTVKNVRINMTTSKENAILTAIMSNDNNLDIENIGVVSNAKITYGIIGGNTGGLLTNTIGPTEETVDTSSLFDGQTNTDILTKKLQNSAKAATATREYYVGTENDANFGKGSWYLPSIGELMQASGIDFDNINSGYGTSGNTKADQNIINQTLQELQNQSIDVNLFTSNYWTSSLFDNDCAWTFNATTGKRYEYAKFNLNRVRAFQNLENFYKAEDTTKPKIGDIVYTNLSFGQATEHDASKGTIAGIITEVNDDGSIKLMSLKNITIADTQGQPTDQMSWGSHANITGIEYINHTELLQAINPNAQIVSSETLNTAFADIDAAEYEARYNEAISQYDSLIKDSSYKSINLLNNDNLEVCFNEDNSNKIKFSGKDMTSGTVGLSLADWARKEGILQSVNELKKAVATLRSYSSELGNNYSIITNRQEFTENLINVLTEGADKLTLADMNEESANMLALQTRQQLAVNALSLASQASQGILKLF